MALADDTYYSYLLRRAYCVQKNVHDNRLKKRICSLKKSKKASNISQKTVESIDQSIENLNEIRVSSSASSEINWKELNAINMFTDEDNADELSTTNSDCSGMTSMKNLRKQDHDQLKDDQFEEKWITMPDEVEFIDSVPRCETEFKLTTSAIPLRDANNSESSEDEFRVPSINKNVLKSKKKVTNPLIGNKLGHFCRVTITYDNDCTQVWCTCDEYIIDATCPHSKMMGLIGCFTYPPSSCVRSEEAKDWKDKRKDLLTTIRENCLSFFNSSIWNMNHL